MKMRGAIPSHPIPPPLACTAKIYCMLFLRSERMYPPKISATNSAAQLSYHHGVWIDFGRVPSASGFHPGRSHGFGRDHTPERERDSSPSEIECRTRFIVSR